MENRKPDGVRLAVIVQNKLPKACGTLKSSRHEIGPAPLMPPDPLHRMGQTPIGAPAPTAKEDADIGQTASPHGLFAHSPPNNLDSFDRTWLPEFEHASPQPHSFHCTAHLPFLADASGQSQQQSAHLPGREACGTNAPSKPRK